MGAFLYFAEINWITKVTFEGVSQRKHFCFVEEMVGPEPIRCKGACINMHSTLQHFQHGEHNCFVLFWDLLFYRVFFFPQQEDMSKGSCTKESADVSDHCLWALNPKSDGTVPRPFSPFLMETEGQTCSIHKLFNPNPSIIMICT